MNAWKRKGPVKIMELMQLEMFVALVEEGSMTNAARRVFRTQPAVSIALRKLEENVGVSLFKRPLRYPILLTPAGVLLHHYAKCLLALRDNALAAMKACGRETAAAARERNAKLPSLLSVAALQQANGSANSKLQRFSAIAK
jgi:DNA-binding transcriptional LysR family regulator